MKATYGTGVFMLANVGEDLPDGGAEGLFPTVAWRIGGTVEFALDGGVFTAGALLNWLSEDLGLAPDAAGLAALAAQVEDSGGVRILPALAGLGAPWWRSEAHAVVSGLSAGARTGHIARAALEAIAWRVADILAVVSEHVSLDVLRVDGGLTRDPLLMQLQADTGGVPVQRGAVDATAAGSAALAAVGRRPMGLDRRDRRAAAGGRAGRAGTRRRLAGARARRLAPLRRGRRRPLAGTFGAIG